ncbi:uncharacterized protein LOC121873282 [Homarus americanus]|uniref:Uncharacterized protein n=1 Tax=Homarus americanus TaxID=6706 RepID=A0A8J5JXW5_HOMAM|nr:uncharacterized protein LOC121873282 [Homarus americanus]XP_042232669.1 uncharacterized protein LOC121873282 [Homarus americanus]KAG7163138.1 hypothetical protein Hamer_G002214 [Homarus americanus]
MMSSERMADLSTSNTPCLSPELLLGTMNTSDMFDTSWDSSSGVYSGFSGTRSSSPSLSPQADLTDDNIFVWDSDHVLQANLFETNIENCIQDEMDLLTFANDFHVAEEDLGFLHDTTSNMSDASSSSSTITSYSVPQSPDHSSGISPDISSLDTSPTSMLFSSLSANLLESSSLNSVLPDNFLNEETQENSGVCSNELTHESKKLRVKSGIEGLSGRRANHPKKHKKSRRSPLTTASQVPSNSNMFSNSVPVSPSCDQTPSMCQWYKVSTKENGVSPRKKKVFNILDSNIKWSDLSSSEQWAVGEGLGVVLSQFLGVRERLDLVNLLSSKSPTDAPIMTSEHDLISSLDDEKLESIRRYLRGLGNEETTSVSRLSNTSYGKTSQKCRNNNSFRKRGKLFYYSKKPKNVAGGKVDKKIKLSHHPSTQYAVSQSARLPTHEVNTTQWSNHHKDPKKSLPLKYQGSKKGKKCISQDLLQLRTRTRKEYKQLMKEKRSGLFKQEEVICVSAATCQGDVQQHDQDEEDEGDVDILG